jgi:hypothetical protein
MRRRAALLTLLALVVAALAVPAGAQAGLTCMPRPSACGFPDETNTGVQPGVQLTPINGTVQLNQDGQVLENALVRGMIVVTAKNVTIRNVKLVATDTNYGIRAIGHGSSTTGVQNLQLDHIEIDLNGIYSLKGIAFDNYTMRHAFIHNGADCAHQAYNATVEDSFCSLGTDLNSDGWVDPSFNCDTTPVDQTYGLNHLDGFQSDGGSNITLRHNTIRNPCSQDSGILMSTNTAPISNVVIDSNLAAGGGFTIYCGTDSGGIVAHETYTNNVISKQYFPKGGYYGPTTWCDRAEVSSGNIWDGDFVLPPAAAPAGGPASGTAGSGTPGAAKSAVYFLSGPRASRVTRFALKRELGRRYTRRAKGMHISCHRGSRSAISCTVKWKSRAQRGGTRHRYSGTVTVKRTAVASWHYSLRIRSWSSGCDCSVVVKRTRSI